MTLAMFTELRNLAGSCRLYDSDGLDDVIAQSPVVQPVDPSSFSQIRTQP